MAPISSPATSNFKLKFPQLSLKKQLLIVFSSTVIISLFIAQIISILYTFLSIFSISTTSDSLLFNQIANSISDSVLTPAAELFEAEVLNRLVDAGVSVVAVAGEDVFRGDGYSMDVQPSYFDGPSTLASPVTQEASAR
jgi:Ca2+/Na+ antiporter